MSKIITNDVSLNLNGKTILSNINLTLNKAEFTVLIGPNGSGKSSLLKVLSGFEKPSQGSIFLNGRSINGYSAQQMSLERAVLSQSIHLGFPITNKEVVKMGLLENIAHKHAKQLMTKALSLTGATHLQDKYYDHCSGGEKCLVQMARILTQLWTSRQFPDQVLFLDEPTAALDLQYQIKILSLCKKLSQQGMSVFCILHDMQLASHYADRVIVIKEGGIVDQGEPEKVLKETMTKKIFKVTTNALPHPTNSKPMLITSPSQ